VNDPGCPRCSLQPICLPDEINHQRLSALTVDGAAPKARGDGKPAPDELTPRKLWPPRGDGIHVVLQREGVRVGVRGQSVRIGEQILYDAVAHLNPNAPGGRAGLQPHLPTHLTHVITRVQLNRPARGLIRLQQALFEAPIQTGTVRIDAQDAQRRSPWVVGVLWVA
jgi:hypothetical protein